MSTRILGLLTTTAAISVALTAGIAAAAAAAAPPPAPDPAVPQIAAQQPPAAPPAETAPSGQSAAEGQDAAESAKADKDCADANCEIKVHDGQTIRFDKKYQLAPVHIGIEGDQVTISSHSRHAAMVSTMSATRAGSSVTNNGVTFRPKLNRDGTITLKITRD
ncbi:Uncharacterised protein [Mycobacterium tuberculosis]|nr:Uncharacterised protein [Mycobacterium tuberculosis]